jgi:hypothetical protein
MAGRSYQQLLKDALVNFEYFNEDIQSRGSVPMTMVPTACRFAKHGRSVGLIQEAAGGTLVSSGVLASLVDVTGTFTCEACFRVAAPGLIIADIAYFLYQISLGGFFFFTYSSPGARDVRVYLVDAAGATARRVYSPPNVFKPGEDYCHAVVVSRNGGTDGLIVINGETKAALFSGVGVAANCVPAVLTTAYTASIARVPNERVRLWQGELSGDEIMRLLEEFRRFTRPSMV